MKADLASFDSARVGYGQPTGRAATGLAALARALLFGASLAAVACGVVAAALWFAWTLAEVVP
jgi:hypothetical protein